uniref:Uncharacterized protein n=1 Tax=Sus scrofa TaxID=9823 RepID=A0A8D0RUP9_PIG
MVNGIVSLNSLSDLSLLVYRNTINFIVLILYPETSPNTLMSSNIYLVVSLGFSRYCTISSANSGSFTSSFAIWICFILFFSSSMIAVARTSKTTLNRSGRRGHPCLFTDLNRNSFSFLMSKMMLALGLSYMAFIMLR